MKGHTWQQKLRKELLLEKSKIAIESAGAGAKNPKPDLAMRGQIKSAKVLLVNDKSEDVEGQPSKNQEEAGDGKNALEVEIEVEGDRNAIMADMLQSVWCVGASGAAELEPN